MTTNLATLLLGAALGAVLTLLGSAFVQTVVVPRVDKRKRREARFEAALLDLGVALTTDVSDRELAVKRAITDSFGADDDSPRAADDAAREWDQFAQRIDWLVGRVLDVRDDAVLRRHYQAWQREAERFLLFAGVSPDGSSWTDWDELTLHDLVWGASDAEFDERQHVVTEVERLLRT